MTNKETPLEQMASLATEMTEVAVAGQAAGLRLLAAEMEALAHMMPGISGGVPADTGHPTQAEIEADFDNMPV